MEEYPVCYCPVCKKLTVVDVKTFIHKKSKIEVNIVSCPLCDTCLNIDKEPEIFWWTANKIEKKLGWKIQKEKSINRLLDKKF